MTINGALGVGNAIERPGSKDNPNPTRLVMCTNGHGAIGQVYIAGLKYWAGECRDCGENPQK